jgi:hypothetical protein
MTIAVPVTKGNIYPICENGPSISTELVLCPCCPFRLEVKGLGKVSDIGSIYVELEFL